MAGLDSLRTVQWNALFEVVRSEGFEPKTDVIQARVDGDALGFVGGELPGLVHVGTGSSFAITHLPAEILRELGGRARGPFAISFSPGWDSPHEQKVRITWDDVLGEARFWLRRVREDMAPSLWELAQQDRKLLADAAGNELANTPFTAAEQARIAEALRAVHDEIRLQGELNVEQLKHLEGTVANAIEASARLGRKDWLLLLYGSIVNLGLQAAFAPTQAQHLWQVATHALAWIVTNTPLLGR